MPVKVADSIVGPDPGICKTEFLTVYIITFCPSLDVNTSTNVAQILQ